MKKYILLPVILLILFYMSGCVSQSGSRLYFPQIIDTSIQVYHPDFSLYTDTCDIRFSYIDTNGRDAYSNNVGKILGGKIQPDFPTVPPQNSMISLDSVSWAEFRGFACFSKNNQFLGIVNYTNDRRFTSDPKRYYLVYVYSDSVVTFDGYKNGSLWYSVHLNRGWNEIIAYQETPAATVVYSNTPEPVKLRWIIE